ncbi:hypothetical protein [Thalassospira sp. MCCC 1A01428]|uniref:hypothetical protein n=1 Tax=Thalassospira sp. MCCC 1A01428 TaxID=1470575 RepID=UPI000A1F6641|nr:hypothetical protein [Thalassospira sp. MCCC 1A01428]OSQ33573.1 hypothetical protein THS27_26080 [Thalassospira sp. MCCC 1A01428]
MAVFNIVATTDTNIAELEKAIEKCYDETDRLRVNDLYWLVSDNKSSVDVAKKIGIVSSDRVVPPAIVTKVDTYYGRAPSNIWEWMKVKIEGGANE